MESNNKINLILKIIFIFGMLCFGTLNIVLKKIQNETSSMGLNNEKELFSKPWFQTLLMFFAESICLWIWLIIDCINKINSNSNSNSNSNFNQNENENKKSTFW